MGFVVADEDQIARIWQRGRRIAHRGNVFTVGDTDDLAAGALADGGVFSDRPRSTAGVGMRKMPSPSVTSR